MTEDILRKKFGFETFRKGQREAVQAAVAGKNSLVMLPTGTGKSLCYQMPSYFLEGLTVIISPLLSLMQDQVGSIKLRGEHRVATLNSLVSNKERRYILNHLVDYRYLFLSPEMIINQQILKRLKSLNVSLFVVDEAHCISQWGMDFRPDYLKLGSCIKELDFPPTMALTATATPEVLKEIKEYLYLEKRELTEVVYPVDRSEIYFHVEICQQDKDTRLLHYLKRLSGSGIIYFRSKEKCEQITALIQDELGVGVASYHGDIDGIDREKIQQQFLAGELEIICATSAFGMGIDKEDIRYIIHYHLPESPEMYLQEVGRVSRDNKLGLALLLYESGDEKIHYFFQSQSQVDYSVVQSIYNNINQLKNRSMDYPLEQLVYYFAQEKVPIHTAWKKIQNHMNRRKEQLQFMMNYIYHEDCKRQFLLDYFNENKKEENECCSICHPEIIQSIYQRSTKINKHFYKKNYNWNKLLTKLFKNISNSYPNYDTIGKNEVERKI